LVANTYENKMGFAKGVPKAWHEPKEVKCIPIMLELKGKIHVIPSCYSTLRVGNS
jgi:hypothetical protein